MMETECVVCGSVNDIRSSRCFVCGAELPPQGTSLSTKNGERGLSSFQALAPPVKVPLSVGALPLEEVLSRRPAERSWTDQGVSDVDLDPLLGPEELDLSSPPFELSMDSEIATESKVIQRASPISEERDEEDSVPSTWIGIPVVDSESNELKAFQAQGSPSALVDDDRSASPLPSRHRGLESTYSPVSELLNDHSREEESSTKSSTGDPLKRSAIIIPREGTLTGAELKQLEAEATPSRWDSSPKEQSADSLLNSDRSLISPEGETALKVSIPDLLAVDQPRKSLEEESSLAQHSFVPVSSLPHSPLVSTLLEDDMMGEQLEVEEEGCHKWSPRGVLKRCRR